MRKTFVTGAVVVFGLALGGTAMAATGVLDTPRGAATAGLQAAAIDAETARQFAEAAVPGATAYEVRAEDGGWKVHLTLDGVKYEVRLDSSGGIIEIEKDGPAPAGTPSPSASATRDAGDDRGGRDGGHGTDDGATHDLGDDHGGHGDDDGATHDARDDHGGDDDGDDNSGHGGGDD